MRSLLRGLLFTVVLTTTFVNAQSQMAFCLDLPASRLNAGGIARVMPDVLLRMRAAAGIDGVFVRTLSAGDEVRVIHGPHCADGYAWWYVGWRGDPGWVAEGDLNDYWLEPVSDQPLQAEIPFLRDQNFNPSLLGISMNVPFFIGQAAFGNRIAQRETGYGIEPRHIRIEFRYETETLAGGEIRVYPAEDYVQITGANLTPLASSASARLQDIPLIPELRLTGGREVFVIQPERVDFQNGVGVRYIAAYSDGLDIYHDYFPRYVFTGITGDGANVVVADFPIASYLLPDEETAQQIADEMAMDSFYGQYQQYLDGLIDMLRGAPSQAFYPDPYRIDSFIESLSVLPEY